MIVNIKFLPSFILLICGLSMIAQVPKGQEFNTGAGMMVGMFDANWEVAQGDTLEPTSLFKPALVVGNCDDLWFNSPTSKANWIPHTQGSSCYHAGGNLDLYFRRNITLPTTDDCGRPIAEGFCLDMDMNADNCIYEILVNGVPVFQYSNNSNPYQYNGLQNTLFIKLCDHWQAGQNTLQVHIKSNPTAVGFLAIAKPEEVINRSFLGKDTVICSASTFRISSPDEYTRWFDNSIGQSKTVENSGQYWATRQDANGCDYSDTILVQFNEEFYIPNVFSPNDDGINDVFTPFFGSLQPMDFTLKIFNRWGGQVFQTSDFINGWDGSNQVKTCDPGVYVYYILAKMGPCENESKGEVILIR